MKFTTLSCLLLGTIISVSTIAFAEPITSGTVDSVHQALLNDYKPEKISDHVYVIHGPLEMPTPENKGFMNNPAFIISENSVAVIDPGASLQVGRAVLAHIKKITDKPITQVFNTHVHGDHWLGNQAFFEANPDVKIYAHPKMIEAAKAGDAEQWVGLISKLTNKATDGTKAIIPTEALEDGQEIKAGDVTIKVYLSEHAHTKTDAMFEIKEDKVLFTGDNMTNKRIPGMSDASFRGNISVIDQVLQDNFDKVVPGHGLTGDKQLLESYKNYLSIIYESVKSLQEEGLEDFEMKDKIVEKLTGYKDWAGFDDEIGKHISLAVLEAERAEFE